MMSSNICWLLVRLAILLGVLLVLSSEEATYRQFENSHIDFPRTSAANLNAYRNLMMMQRGLTYSDCKPTNTFINARPSVVQQVCRRRERHQNFRDSQRDFDVVMCSIIGGQAPKHCRYHGQWLTRRVRLECVNNLPVHFQQLL